MATKQLVDVEETSMTASQLAGNLIGLLTRVKENSFTPDQWRALQEGRNPFAPAQVVEVDIRDCLAWWSAHYQNFYGMNPDFSGLVIPPRQPGFDFLVIMAKGWQMSQWVEAANRIHGVWLYKSDLDATVPEHDRSCRERSYAIWIRDRREADEELKNLSANQLRKQKISGIALPERLVAGSAHLLLKGRHMDEDNVTLCSGSRYSDGHVPCVYWYSGDREVGVGACDADDADARLRARAVVS